MRIRSFLIQTRMYFLKIARISLREKAWLSLAFPGIITIIVNLVTAKNMFHHFDDTLSGFFTLGSACIWIGIFNTIQSVCKEHSTVRMEYREGAMLSSYVSAQVLWQAVLCLVQSFCIYFFCKLFGFFKNGSTEGILFHSSTEYLVTIFLLTFGAAVLGLMISAMADQPTTAMMIMPFVLIIQLIMSGVLFQLKGLMGKVAGLTFSKWGMSAFGSIGNINKLDTKIMDVLVEEYGSHFDKAVLAKNDAIYEHVARNLWGPWIWCLVLTIIFALLTYVGLRLRNLDS